MNTTFSGKRAFEALRLRVDLTSVTGVLLRERRGSLEVCREGARVWSRAAMSQGGLAARDTGGGEGSLP